MYETGKMSFENSKKRIQNFVMKYFDRHGYLKNKDPDQVASILVYDYLVQNGYKDVAQNLAKEILDRPDKDFSRKRKLSECESDESVEKVSKLTDPDRIAFTLVIDYLNKFGYQGFAQELETEVKYSKLDLQGLDLQTVLKSQKSKSDRCDPENISINLVIDYFNKHGYQGLAQELQNEVNFSRIDLQGLDLSTVIKSVTKVPRIICDKTSTKMSKSRLSQVPETQMMSSKRKMSKSKVIQVPEEQQPMSSNASRKRKLDNCDKTGTKVLKLSDPDQLDDLNQRVTITDLFIDKLDDLKSLPQDSEIPKAVKFILDSNIKVRKSVRNTFDIIPKQCKRVYFEKNFAYIRSDKLSGLRYGDASEESLILKQWNNLVKGVPIYVPEKFLIQIEETTLSWCQTLLGAFLSRDMTENHRCASQLFNALISLKKRKGGLTPEEDELILALGARNAPSTEWKKLATDMGRSVDRLWARLHYLKNDKGKSTRFARFTLEEDRKILEYVNERFDISSSESLKSMKSSDLHGLTKVIARGQTIIVNRWRGILMPAILSYLYGVPEIQWRNEFLKFIIHQKVMNLTSINWTDVLQKWPYQTKFNLTRTLDIASRYCKDNNTDANSPLYKQVSNYLSHPIKKGISLRQQDQRRAVLKIFDEIRSGNKQ